MQERKKISGNIKKEAFWWTVTNAKSEEGDYSLTWIELVAFRKIHSLILVLQPYRETYKQPKKRQKNEFVASVW